MKGIYIPDYNCAFVTANKSGSRVILNTIMMFCHHSRIKYNELIDSNYTAIPNVKYYILVRNPIDRFFTTYSWLMRDVSLLGESGISQIKNVIEKYNIKSIDDYARNYRKMYDDLEYDSHFVEQYYSFIPSLYHQKSAEKSSKLDIIKLFDSIYKNYEFIQIETLSQISENYKNNFTLYDETTSQKSDFSFIIDLFSEFKSISIKEKELFNIFYNYITQILDSKHHNKHITNSIKNEYFNTITEKYGHLFKTELKLYGYPYYDNTQLI
jgi:hypothetical protein